MQEPASYPVFTQDDQNQIAKQQGTLEQFNIRLTTCDTELSALKKKVDEDVLPTIHVFRFSEVADWGHYSYDCWDRS